MASGPVTHGTAERESIYLIGTSGFPNFGDEFIAAAWLRFLARARPEADVWLDCPHPGTASHLFEGLHPRLRTTDTLWRLVRESAHLPGDQADHHVDRVVTHLGSPQFDLGLVGARRAHLLHLIGGGHLNAMWPHQLRLLRAALRLGELGGARVVATGLGLSPVAAPARLRETVSALSFASVRDQPSAETSGAVLSCDDAFLALDVLPGFHEVTERGDRDVWVCLQTDLARPEAFEAAVAGVRAALTGPLAGRPVRYLEAIPGGDRAAFDRLSDVIPAEHFVPFAHLWREGFPARPGQTWLTSRFHFHLLAAACGAEGAAIEVNEDYYRVKHRSLVDAGTGWSTTRTGEPVVSPSGGGVFRARAVELGRVKLAEAQAIYPVHAPVVVPAPRVPPSDALGRPPVSALARSTR